MRPHITDESVFRRWMSLEIGKINDGIVAERKYLVRLLEEEVPSATTRAGKEYLFDRDIIRTIGDRLPEEIKNTLRLPILFFFTPDVRGSYYTGDETALQALQHLGELGPMRRMHEGKLWVARAIVFSIMKKYPTVIQIVMG